MADPVYQTPADLAARVRQKYPGAYDKKSDTELSQAWLTKYPVYWKNVNAGEFAKKGLWQPSSTMNQTQVNLQTGQQHPIFNKVANEVVNSAPSIGGAVGAAAGMLSPVPGGAVMGAAAGGMLGKEIQQRAQTGTVSEKNNLESGAIQGGLEYVGGTLAPKVLTKIGDAAGPRALKLMNNYMGLSKSSLPKMGRTLSNAQDIAKTVLEKVGVKKTLPDQIKAIEATRQYVEDQTAQIVKHPGSHVADATRIIRDRGLEEIRNAIKENLPKETAQAIRANMEELERIVGVNNRSANPEQLLMLRRSIQKQIKNWGADVTQVREHYLQAIYHDLNDAIAKTLPPAQAKQFLAANRIQNRLIIARTAATNRELSEGLKKSAGIATKATRVAGKTAAGAVMGGAIGAEYGHGSKSAVAGAVAGALYGLGVEKSDSVELPVMDIKAQQAMKKLAPYLAKAAKASPNAARVAGEALKSYYSQ